MRTYYRSCPHCGANLDPGEKCDCKRSAAPGVRDRKAAERNYTAIIADMKGKVKS